ncbi:alpha/beta fold hydrolase, partial [Pseudonocardia autotrophica]
HSFGATLGIEYAATHGHRVAGLIYCSGLGIGWSIHRATYKARQAQRLTAAERTRSDELAARNRTWDEEVEWRTLSWLPDFVDPGRARQWAASDASTPLALNLACNRAFNAETSAWTADDEISRWSAVTCPVWIVHGEGDPRPADGPRTLASILPDAGIHEIADAGHQPWRERPDVVAQILTAVAAHASGPS